MLSFDDMQRIHCNTGTIGQQLKQMSDEVIQETFDNDIQTRQCYIYDHYHDDQADIEYGYDPSLSNTKIPVKLKFIVKTYKSMAKDDPDYHIMFEPFVWNSMKCKPDWFENNYQSLGIKFPVGLYVDIPDDMGIYHRWLITYSEVANQFPKFGVLRCNYRFKWIHDDGINRYKRKIWGVEATQNSYTSGIYTDYIMTRYEEQGKFYLPWTPISSELKHDTRLCISMLQKEPYVYQITKVKNTHPKGIIAFTVKQDRFEPEHDYVSLNPESDDYGDMYADYYSSTIVPNEDVEDIESDGRRLSIEAASYNVKLGASKVLNVKVYDLNNNDVTNEYSDYECIWNVEMDNLEDINYLIVVDDDYSLKEENKFKYKFKFNGNERYLNNNINVTCKIDNMSTTISLDIIAL